MSKLVYGISAWGCVSGIPGQTEDSRSGFSWKDLRRLQSLLNKAVRLIFRRDPFTPTKELLGETGQLSVNQCIAYHILTQTFKIKLSQQPEYHFRRLFEKDGRNSRTNPDNIKRIDFRLNIGRCSFFYQASRLWSSLPPYIKNCASISNFKSEIRVWISVNIPLKPF